MELQITTEREETILSPQELQPIPTQAQADGYYELFLLDLRTGLRRGELLTLQLDDLYLWTGALTVSRQGYEVKEQLQMSIPKTRLFLRNLMQILRHIKTKSVIQVKESVWTKLTWEETQEIEQICVVATAPSKTFNVAGLQMSAIIIANEELRQKFQKETEKRVMYIANLFGAVAFEAAYGDPECEEYLEQLIDYLWENYLFLDRYLRENMPKIKCQKPDATYLLWLDCRELGLNSEELQKFCLEEAGVAFDVGEWFGGDGDGFMRINIGCPRSLLKEGLDRMKAAYDRRSF